MQVQWHVLLANGMENLNKYSIEIFTMLHMFPSYNACDHVASTNIHDKYSKNINIPQKYSTQNIQAKYSRCLNHSQIFLKNNKNIQKFQGNIPLKYSVLLTHHSQCLWLTCKVGKSLRGIFQVCLFGCGEFMWNTTSTRNFFVVFNAVW